MNASRRLRRGSETTMRSTVVSGDLDHAQAILKLGLRRSEEGFLAALGMTELLAEREKSCVKIRSRRLKKGMARR